MSVFRDGTMHMSRWLLLIGLLCSAASVHSSGSISLAAIATSGKALGLTQAQASSVVFAFSAAATKPKPLRIQGTQLDQG